MIVNLKFGFISIDLKEVVSVLIGVVTSINDMVSTVCITDSKELTGMVSFQQI